MLQGFELPFFWNIDVVVDCVAVMAAAAAAAAAAIMFVFSVEVHIPQM